MEARSAEIEAYEEEFRRSGLPLFIEGFSAETDVWNRAAPLLAFVFIAEMFGAIQLEWAFIANLGAAVGGLAILLLAAGAINRWQGRPFTAVPEDVEELELAAFVLIPAILPLIFGGQVGSAIGTAAFNIGLLALIYGVLALGMFSILRWVADRLVAQLRASFGLLARAVPLLLVFVLLAFVNTEMWQAFAAVTQGGLILIGVLFLFLGSAFLVARLPREVDELEEEVGQNRPLDKRQRLNVATVLFISQAVQVISVTVLIGLFFVGFGMLTIDEAVRESWIGYEGNELFSFPLFGEQVEITSELLRVSGGLAAFSGLYFAISMLTDSTYREEFLDELTEEMRESFRKRARYLSLLPDYEPPPPAARES